MDTWFSSWLWPIAVFDTTVFKDGNKGNEDLNYYYPTNDLVTAPEILFFWVARMIIAGYEYRSEKPFKNVYLTGIVRDKQGRKMSKSLGNSPDPLDLIANSGADAVRTGMLFSSPAGNDLLYDEKLIEQGRNFANKIWNAFRLVKGFEVTNSAQPEENKIGVAWFESRINEGLAEYNDHLNKFRISDALHSIYKLVWTDFCSWYLEIIKPEFGQPIDKTTYDRTIRYFETLLKALHPFMPFITEELWHELQERGAKDCIIVASWPKASSFNQQLLDEASMAFDIISEVRNTRASKGLSPKEALKLLVKNGENAAVKSCWSIVKKLSNLSEISFVTTAPETSATGFIVKSTEFFIPMEGKIDVDKEREAIQKELEYHKGFIISVDKKLSNEKFVANAKPEVVAIERKKKADAEAKVKALEESLARL
jgi:valyl-tRNA synthetase